jgi:hypothetical protein
MFADVVAVAGQHAEIFRPRRVERAVDDDVPDIAGAQRLRLGRKPEEPVDLALDKRIDRFDRRVSDPMDVGYRVARDLKTPVLGSNRHHNSI